MKKLSIIVLTSVLLLSTLFTRCLPAYANKLLILGEFVLKSNSTTYYFDSVIKCKGGEYKKTTWRLIPNLLIDQFVFIGWET